MPVWHELTAEARAAGKLALIGVIQEQHPDRGRLFAQWQGFDWPILHDPINLLNVRAVPVFVAIDEAGIVVDANLQPSEIHGFLDRTVNGSTKEIPIPPPNVTTLDHRASESNVAADSIAAGDYRVLWDGHEELETAIRLYRTATRIAPENGAARFRLGVALRMRYDSPTGHPQDFQQAVNAWGHALDVDPNHYIYRRRIQQYGPRLSKPYPFYDWIQQARDEIADRGEHSVTLSTEPVGAEIAQPAKRIRENVTPFEEPDPDGRIRRDAKLLVETTVVVVPGMIDPGNALRVHLRLRPTAGVHWNNEADPLTIWIELPEGWSAETRLLNAPQPPQPESRETRVLDFELQSPKAANSGSVKAYALYYVCSDDDGLCRFLRQEIEIPVQFR